MMQLVINRTDDILAALDGGDWNVAAAVLRAIALDPRKALSYGSDNGRDLTAELDRRFRAARGNVLKTGYFAAMTAINAPEYLEAYKIGFNMSGCPEIVLASASRLADRPREQTEVFLTRALFNDGMPQQAQLAANIMCAFTGLGNREAIRVALLANNAITAIPPLNAETSEDWLAELSGVLRESAKTLLEHEAGESGFKVLKTGWLDLAPPLQAWLLDWGARSYPVQVLDRLADGIVSPHRGVVLAALGGLASRPEFATFFRDRIAELFRSDDRDLRLAAIKAMAETDETVVADARDDDEAFLIAVKKLPAKKSLEKAFFELLRDARWPIRSVATRKLIEIGAAAEDFADGAEFPKLEPGILAALSKVEAKLGKKTNDARRH